MDKYDLIIVGSGPGGLTAGLYASRAELSTLIFEKDLIGGLPNDAHQMENYPGFPESLSGEELANRMAEQAEKFGANIKNEAVEKIEIRDNDFKVKTKRGEYLSEYVIVASGSEYIKPDIPGVEKFDHRGVSYCATCDGPLYEGAEIAVIGCGNTGLQEGQYLLKFADKVHFIEFLPEMTGEKIHQKRVRQKEGSCIHLNTKLVSINGDKNVESITVQDRENDEQDEIEVEGVFIFIGLEPVTDFLPSTVETTESGHIITDESLETSVENMYAVGDVREKEVRQMTTATADGTIAAVTINEVELRKEA